MSPMLPTLRWCALVVAGLSVTSSALPCQQSDVRIRLVLNEGGPVTGALVALLDASGGVIAEGLTSEEGRRLLRAAPGTYRIRVRRIGFEPYVSPAFSIPRPDELVLRLDSRPIALNRIVVSARTACRRRDDAAGVATVWQEIAKALRASELTNDDLAGIARAFSYQKEVHRDGAVTTSDTATFVVRGVRPFAAVDPGALARDGYVRGDEYRGWEYFGPDEAVLLSEEFAATHCFWLVRNPERPGKLGLGFEPVPRRRVPDIRGVLWLDEQSSELEVMEFQYVNAGAPSEFESGGFTRFRRVPSGAWIVAEWKLRFPRLRIRPGAFATASLLGWRENGGGILIQQQPIAHSGTVTVVGTTYDSVALRPLPRALVVLHDSPVRSDDSGRFTFSGVPRGITTITLVHPQLSALGVLALERGITLGGDTTLTLATPSLRASWARICDDTSRFAGSASAGIVHGWVRDEDGRGIPAATVRFTWSEPPSQVGMAASAQHLRLDVGTDSEGKYAACGFRQGVAGSVSIASGAPEMSRREFSFGAGFEPSPILRRDLTYRRGETTALTPIGRDLLIVVVDSAGHGLADATVDIAGTVEQMRTDDNGRALLRTTDSVVTVGVRRLGYSARTLRVTIRDAATRQLRVVLAPIQTLATVRVTGTATLPREIERRRMLGTGWFYGPEDLERVQSVKTLLGRTPGASFVGTARWAVRFRHPTMGGDCWGDLYIDGRLVDPGTRSATGEGRGGATITLRDEGPPYNKFAELDSYSPEEIHAIEVFPRASEAPPSIVRLRDGCGVILVWTTSWAEHELQLETSAGRR